MKKITLLLALTALLVPSAALAQSDGEMPADDGTMDEPMPAADPAPAPAPPPPAPPAPMVEEEEEEGSIMDNISYQVFATGYYQFIASRRPNTAPRPGFAAYAREHGFGVPFVGGDFSYSGEDFGVTINLRYGQGAPGLISGGATNGFLGPLKQGYATWNISDSLTLDVGWFDTIYGAEVADEWENVNYTRGALYFLMQPFNHAGLRLGVEVSDTVGLTFLVVNGNFDFPDISDVNETPSFGAQVSLAPNDDTSIAIGYATGADNGNNDWYHFVDIVAGLGFGDFSLVLNADFRMNPQLPGDISDNMYFGVSAAAAYSLSDTLGLGARVEFLSDPGNGGPSGGYAGLGADWLITVTPTIRYTPVENLVLTLEPRVEFAESEIYSERGGDTNDIYFSILAGLTARFAN